MFRRPPLSTRTDTPFPCTTLFLSLSGTEEADRVFDRQVECLGNIQATEAIFKHRRLEPLAVAVLTGCCHRLHEPEFGIDHPGAVAGRAGALGEIGRAQV